MSQSTLANKMGTNSSGTVLGTMCDVLNDDYITGDEYVPMALWQTGVVLANQIQYSINASNPVIAVCRTGVLPNYDKNINHYLCITGYDYSADISVYECKYNDPNWDDDYYGSYWTTVPTMNSRQLKIINLGLLLLIDFLLIINIAHWYFNTSVLY